MLAFVAALIIVIVVVFAWFAIGPGDDPYGQIVSLPGPDRPTGTSSPDPSPQIFTAADLRHPARAGRSEIAKRESRSVKAPPPLADAEPSLPPFGSLEGPVYQIEYVDAEGVVTERVVRLKDVNEVAGRQYLEAWCYRAQDDRTFRLDRVTSLIDHRTGRKIDDPMAFFGRIAEPQIEFEGEHTAVMSRARAGLLGLIWIAQTDGGIAQQEIELMLGYIGRRAALTKAGAGLRWDQDGARRWIENEVPTFDSAMGAVGRMGPTGREAILFRNFATKLANSDRRRKRMERLFRALA